MATVKNQGNAFLAELFEIVLSPDFYFNDGEMETVTGLERPEWEEFFRKICEAQETYTFGRLDVCALDSAILNIWGYPHNMNSEVLDRLSIDLEHDDAEKLLEIQCAKHRIRVITSD